MDFQPTWAVRAGWAAREVMVKIESCEPTSWILWELFLSKFDLAELLDLDALIRRRRLLLPLFNKLGILLLQLLVVWDLLDILEHFALLHLIR